MADTVSFDEAFSELFGVAYRVSYRILGSRPDAEDVAQEALARASLAWPRVARYANPWVAKVAADKAIDVWRRAQRRPHSVPDPPVDRLVTVEQRRELVVALRTISRRQREVVVMRYLADFSELETAAALGCSVGTVKRHGARGLAALRRHLRPSVIGGT